MNEHTLLPHDHGEAADFGEHIPSQATVQTVSAAMKQLGDPSRLRIFWILCHYEECVQNLAALTSMSSPAVSHHLSMLKSSGLVISTRRGKEMYYRAADTPMAASLHSMIEAIADITCPGVQ